MHYYIFTITIDAADRCEAEIKIWIYHLYFSLHIGWWIIYNIYNMPDSFSILKENRHESRLFTFTLIIHYLQSLFNSRLWLSRLNSYISRPFLLPCKQVRLNFQTMPPFYPESANVAFKCMSPKLNVLYRLSRLAIISIKNLQTFIFKTLQSH